MRLNKPCPCDDCYWEISCDGWEKQYCCEYCHYVHGDHWDSSYCDDCDNMDI